MISKRALSIFVKLLGSPNADVREQAVFALGIVACHSPTCRDRVLEHGPLVPLLDQLKEDSQLSMLRNATWALSNFCGGLPRPSFEQVRPALKTLKRLLCSRDWEVLSDSCLALSYLLKSTYYEIGEVIKAGVFPRIVELLDHHSSAVVISALQAIGKFIISGKDSQTQAVIDAQLIGTLLQLLQDAEFDIRVRAALAISNAASGGSDKQIKSFVSVSCIKALFDLVLSPDMPVVYALLNGLFNIMTKGSISLNDKLIKDSMDVGKIEHLTGHSIMEIAERATRLRSHLTRDERAASEREKRSNDNADWKVR